MKTILKNKKGSFVIIGVIIIPIIIFVVFYIIFTQMNRTMSYKRVQSAIDNALYYATTEYGSIKFDKNGEGYCDFDTAILFGESGMNSQIIRSDDQPNPTAKDKFFWDFTNYLKRCDGYNELWSFSLKTDTNNGFIFDSNKNENNEYITAEVIIVLPDQSNKDSICWGTAPGKNVNEWTYWYKENSAHWENCISRYSDWRDDNDNYNYKCWLEGKTQAPTGFIMMKIEVSASCY